MYRFAALFAAAAMLFSACSEAEPLSVEEALKDSVIGDANAPVTLIEYSSLACPHCANFHINTLPEIKKNYIDTGKVKMIVRDYPIGGAAYAAAMMARCVKPARRTKFVDALFANQETWTKASNPKAALARIGKLGGLSQEDFDRCTSDKALFEGIQKLQLEAQSKYDVNATPTFIVMSSKNSDVEKISGAQPYDVFKQAFDKALQ